jgi:hypothetical protein
MDEVECLIVRRIAVKMEQRQGERHGASLGERRPEGNASRRHPAPV